MRTTLFTITILALLLTKTADAGWEVISDKNHKEIGFYDTDSVAKIGKKVRVIYSPGDPNNANAILLKCVFDCENMTLNATANSVNRKTGELEELPKSFIKLKSDQEVLGSHYEDFFIGLCNKKNSSRQSKKLP